MKLQLKKLQKQFLNKKIISNNEESTIVEIDFRDDDGKTGWIVITDSNEWFYVKEAKYLLK